MSIGERKLIVMLLGCQNLPPQRSTTTNNTLVTMRLVEKCYTNAVDINDVSLGKLIAIARSGGMEAVSNIVKAVKAANRKDAIAYAQRRRDVLRATGNNAHTTADGTSRRQAGGGEDGGGGGADAEDEDEEEALYNAILRLEDERGDNAADGDEASGVFASSFEGGGREARKKNKNNQNTNMNAEEDTQSQVLPRALARKRTAAGGDKATFANSGEHGDEDAADGHSGDEEGGEHPYGGGDAAQHQGDSVANSLIPLGPLHRAERILGAGSNGNGLITTPVVRQTSNPSWEEIYVLEDLSIPYYYCYSASNNTVDSRMKAILKEMYAKEGGMMKGGGKVSGGGSDDAADDEEIRSNATALMANNNNGGKATGIRRRTAAGGNTPPDQPTLTDGGEEKTRDIMDSNEDLNNGDSSPSEANHGSSPSLPASSNVSPRGGRKTSRPAATADQPLNAQGVEMGEARGTTPTPAPTHAVNGSQSARGVLSNNVHRHYFMGGRLRLSPAYDDFGKKLRMPSEFTRIRKPKRSVLTTPFPAASSPPHSPSHEQMLLVPSRVGGGEGAAFKDLLQSRPSARSSAADEGQDVISTATAGSTSRNSPLIPSHEKDGRIAMPGNVVNVDTVVLYPHRHGGGGGDGGRTATEAEALQLLEDALLFERQYFLELCVRDTTNTGGYGDLIASFDIQVDLLPMTRQTEIWAEMVVNQRNETIELPLKKDPTTGNPIYPQIGIVVEPVNFGAVPAPVEEGAASIVSSTPRGKGHAKPLSHTAATQQQQQQGGGGGITSPHMTSMPLLHQQMVMGGHHTHPVEEAVIHRTATTTSSATANIPNVANSNNNPSRSPLTSHLKQHEHLMTRRLQAAGAVPIRRGSNPSDNNSSSSIREPIDLEMAKRGRGKGGALIPLSEEERRRGSVTALYKRSDAALTHTLSLLTNEERLELMISSAVTPNARALAHLVMDELKDTFRHEFISEVISVLLFIDEETDLMGLGKEEMHTFLQEMYTFTGTPMPTDVNLSEELRYLFNTFDRDQDEVLTVQEVCNVLRASQLRVNVSPRWKVGHAAGPWGYGSVGNGTQQQQQKATLNTNSCAKPSSLIDSSVTPYHGVGGGASAAASLRISKPSALPSHLLAQYRPSDASVMSVMSTFNKPTPTAAGGLGNPRNVVSAATVAGCLWSEAVPAPFSYTGFRLPSGKPHDGSLAPSLFASKQRGGGGNSLPYDQLTPFQPAPYRDLYDETYGDEIKPYRNEDGSLLPLQHGGAHRSPSSPTAAASEGHGPARASSEESAVLEVQLQRSRGGGKGASFLSTNSTAVGGGHYAANAPTLSAHNSTGEDSDSHNGRMGIYQQDSVTSPNQPSAEEAERNALAQNQTIPLFERSKPLHVPFKVKSMVQQMMEREQLEQLFSSHKIRKRPTDKTLPHTAGERLSFVAMESVSLSACVADHSLLIGCRIESGTYTNCTFESCLITSGCTIVSAVGGIRSCRIENSKVWSASVFNCKIVRSLVEECKYVAQTSLLGCTMRAVSIYHCFVSDVSLDPTIKDGGANIIEGCRVEDIPKVNYAERQLDL